MSRPTLYVSPQGMRLPRMSNKQVGFGLRADRFKVSDPQYGDIPTVYRVQVDFLFWTITVAWQTS